MADERYRPTHPAATHDRPGMLSAVLTEARGALGRLLDEHGDVVDRVERADIQARLADGRMFWLDLPAVGPEEVALLRDVFGFHPLAVEDAAHFGERPKVEDYDHYALIVLYGSGVDPSQADQGPSAPAELHALSEIHCFLAEQYLVTVHRGACPAFRTMLDRAHGRRIPITDPSRLFYRVADTLVDSFFPVLADLDDRLDTLQTNVVSAPRKEQLAELLDYRAALITLRRVVAPQRDLFASLGSQVVELPGFDDEEVRYLRDVYDHLIRLSDLIDSYRDLLSGTTDAYLSVVSNQLNEVMRQLTVISTVFLPLSFLTGFFGQNFAFLVDHIGSWETFVGLGIGTEVLAVVLLGLLFRRRGWLRTAR